MNNHTDTNTTDYVSLSAQQAAASNYGGPDYWAYLDEAAFEHALYFERRGDHETAALMFTQSLSEALAGNDGD